jgi:hypothetical protein
MENFYTKDTISKAKESHRVRAVQCAFQSWLYYLGKLARSTEKMFRIVHCDIFGNYQKLAYVHNSK